MKTALITGATGGFGRALAKKLSSEGYRLALVDFDETKLSNMAKDYPGSLTYILDQRDQKAVEAFCDSVIEDGDVFFDVAIPNAGYVAIGNVATMDRSGILDQLQINLVSTATLIQSLSRRMVREKRGHILSTVSLGGILSLRGSAGYSASKFGLRGLLWALRDEVLPHGVHVTGVYPSGMDTPMLRHEARNGGSALNFVSEPGTAEDVASAFIRALRKPRLEVYVPYSESVTTRLLAAFPWLVRPLYPMLEWLGERGRRKFLRKIGPAESA